MMVNPVWALAYRVDASPSHDVAEFDGQSARDRPENETTGRASKVGPFHIVLNRVQRPLAANLAEQR